MERVRLVRLVGQVVVAAVLGGVLWSEGHASAGAALFLMLAVGFPAASWWLFERPRPVPAAAALEQRLRADACALAHHTALLGPGHPATLTSHDDLARGHLLAGRPELAIRHYQVALTYAIHASGPDGSETLRIRRRLAEAHRAAGHLPQAIAHLSRACADAARRYGPEHRTTSGCRAQLAAARAATAGSVPVGSAGADPR
ncbi:tetratricopeptide repeat protein [Marinitenerispora sediminis]|uniref:tetratricopeptide repeat protein n=1 Tax=Marinitenerispora sediminis TaxID=1931232 RepID=UPI0013146C2D|nr:tetratricopeptide repeat protein [Marinitenerispora sediminis]